MANEHWYALKVRPGFDVVVAQRLRKMHLEAFVAEQRTTSQEPDRRFQAACHVYCRFSLESRQSLIGIPGVLGILGAPEPTRFDAEVTALQAASGSH